MNPENIMQRRLQTVFQKTEQWIDESPLVRTVSSKLLLLFANGVSKNYCYVQTVSPNGVSERCLRNLLMLFLANGKSMDRRWSHDVSENCWYLSSNKRTTERCLRNLLMLFLANGKSMDRRWSQDVSKNCWYFSLNKRTTDHKRCLRLRIELKSNQFLESTAKDT